MSFLNKHTNTAQKHAERIEKLETLVQGEKICLLNGHYYATNGDGAKQLALLGCTPVELSGDFDRQALGYTQHIFERYHGSDAAAKHVLENATRIENAHIPAPSHAKPDAVKVATPTPPEEKKVFVPAPSSVSPPRPLVSPIAKQSSRQRFDHAMNMIDALAFSRDLRTLPMKPGYKTPLVVATPRGMEFLLSTVNLAPLTPPAGAHTITDYPYTFAGAGIYHHLCKLLEDGIPSNNLSAQINAKINAIPLLPPREERLGALLTAEPPAPLSGSPRVENNATESATHLQTLAFTQAVRALDRQFAKEEGKFGGARFRLNMRHVALSSDAETHWLHLAIDTHEDSWKVISDRIPFGKSTSKNHKIYIEPETFKTILLALAQQADTLSGRDPSFAGSLTEQVTQKLNFEQQHTR